MNKGITFLVIAGVVMVVGCTQQEAKTTAVMPSTQEAQMNVDQAKQGVDQAVEQTQQVAAQAEAAVDQAKQVAEEAKANAQDAAKKLAAQAQELLAKAKAFVDSGKFDEAIAQAQEVLKIDPNNIDAKAIIETAKKKISEMVAQKMGDVKQGLADKFGGMGK